MNRSNCLLAAWLILFSAMSSAAEITVLMPDMPPYASPGKDKPFGMAVEILNAATAAGGPSFKYEFLPWTRAQMTIKQRPGTLIGPLTRTPEREPHYRWIAELFEYRIHFVSEQKAPPASLNEAKGMRLGYLHASGEEPLLLKLGFPILDGATDHQTNARKLHAGHIDSWVTPTFIAKWIYHENGYDISTLKAGATLGEPFHIYIAAPIGYPDADAQVIAAAIAKVRANGQAEAILVKYR
jgi:polar amino acid transport system substrate-binding protein